MFHGEISLNLVLLLLLTKFCEWVQVGIDVYIPNRKHQVKPHSFPWSSVACAAAIAHKNHFFHLHQQNKSSGSKVKFRQVYQGFTQALFTTTVFPLRLSLKCSWGSAGCCRLWLKKHSNLLKPLEMALFF